MRTPPSYFIQDARGLPPMEGLHIIPPMDASALHETILGLL